MKLHLSLPSGSRAAAFLLAAAVFASHANAMSLRELRALIKSDKQGENYALYYMTGVMEGVLEARMQDLRNGTKPMICLNGRRLEPRMAKSLFDAELERNAGMYEADMQVQFVLTTALATVYPCLNVPQRNP